MTDIDLTMSEERVAQGTALLDEYNADWWRLVELKTLNILDPWNCILGQVFGNDDSHFNTGYRIGMQKLGIGKTGSFEDTLNATLFGFVYTEDEAVWRRVIEARQAKSKARNTDAAYAVAA